MLAAGLGVVPIARGVSRRVLIPVALMFSVGGYVMVAFASNDNGLVMLMAAFTALGIGIGAAETVSNELVLTSAPPAKAGAASAVSETAYELGAVLGTAVLGGILTAFYRTNLVIPAGVPADAATQARETLGGAVAASEGLSPALGGQLMLASAHAFDGGGVITSLIGAGLMIVAAVIAAVSLRGTRNRA